MAKITELDVRDMGLVDRPANNMPVILKSSSADGDGLYDVKINFSITKVDEAKGILYGIAYMADVVDSQGDWTDEPTLETACHKFLEQGRQREVDLMHDGRLGKGVVVESGMIYAPHKNYPPITTPSWAMAIKIGDEAKLRINEIGGFSISGRAKFDFTAKPPQKSSPKEPVTKRAVKVLKNIKVTVLHETETK
jgi:hypothetical protein